MYRYVQVNATGQLDGDWTHWDGEGKTLVELLDDGWKPIREIPKGDSMAILLEKAESRPPASPARTGSGGQRPAAPPVYGSPGFRSST